MQIICVKKCNMKWRISNMFILDWIDENFHIAGPIGAFIGLAVAVTIALVTR